MQVTLIDYTGAGSPNKDYAIDLLLFTKNTRLNMSVGTLCEISEWPKEKKMKELEYMANTIPSSWEFIDYTFMIEGVTRAFTHQLVRTRTASFAQQTMRVLDVSSGPGWEYLTGPSIQIGVWDEATSDEKERLNTYRHAMEVIAAAYKRIIELGGSIEDARGVLPTNILTNIVMKINMRNYVELVRKRSSSRTQDEYRDVLDKMKLEVARVHPWTVMFTGRTFDKAANDLDAMLRTNDMSDKETKTHAIKLIDQMRAKS